MSAETKLSFDDNPTYSSAEVCLAVGLPRPTFDAWMLRGYMSLPPGPGTGRARRFSLTNAVRLAITAELNRLGVAVSVAAKASLLFSEPFRAGDRRVALVLIGGTAPLSDQDTRAPTVLSVTFESLDDIAYQVALQRRAGAAKFTMLDVTDLAERTIRALEKSPDEQQPPAWLERYLQPRAPAAPTRPRSRKAAAPKG